MTRHLSWIMLASSRAPFPPPTSPSTPIASPRKAAPICFSTPTTPSTGIPGATRRLRRRRRKASSSSCRSATAPATGATSWSASRSRTRRWPSCSTTSSCASRWIARSGRTSTTIYMTALNVTGSRGGWPLSMFLTPDGKPIVGGTYWPPDDRRSTARRSSGFKTHPQGRPRRCTRTSPKTLREAGRQGGRADHQGALAGAGRGVALVELDRDLVTGGRRGPQGGIRPGPRRLRQSQAASSAGPSSRCRPTCALLHDEAQRTKADELRRWSR